MDSSETNGDLTWFELFVDPTVVSKFILDPEKKKQLPRLCMQFTDKGFLAEREKDKGKLAVEELMLFERKAASMRLCAMATFAALDYDIEYIIDNIPRNDLQTLRVLADNFYRIYNEKNLNPTFGNWLFYRFVLAIDRRNRLSPPAPRATIASTLSNGQLMPTDPAFLKHEKTQRMIAELSVHVLKARAFITELADVPNNIAAPGIQCFLKPFVELAPKAMTAAFLGDRNVLIENPSPDFEAEKVILPASDVANKCLSELVTYLFTCGDLAEARRILYRVVKPTIDHPLVAIDEKVFRSYCQILNVQNTPFSQQITVIRPYVFDLNALNDDKMRKSVVYRQRGVQETSGQLQNVYLAENAALSVIDENPECIRENIRNRAEIERFVKVLKKKLDRIKDRRKLCAIRGHLQYLCASIADLRDILESNGVDVSSLRSFAVPSEHLVLERSPRVEQLSQLIRGNDPYWTIMTEFDLPVLKQALAELGPFWFPTKMQVPENLVEKLEQGVNAPTYTLFRLLLCKLHQLTKMHNFEGFRKNLTSYLTEMGDTWMMTATFEMVHVPAIIGNAHLPWERQLLERDTSQTQAIFNSDHFVPNDNSARMINQCLALMLNVGDAQIVLEKGGQMSMDRFKSVPIARMLGAYLTKYDDVPTQKKCADGFWRTVTQKFIDAQPPRGYRRGPDAEQRILAARKELVYLIHLLSLVRDKRLIDFVLAFAVCLHNKIVLGQRKPHLKIHAKQLDLYQPDPNSPKLEIINTDDTRQVLQMMVEKAYSTSPTDPDTILSYADFLYVEKDFQGAAQKYLEYFASHSPSLRLSPLDPAHSTIFDDTIIHRLRICTNHSGYLTMSLLTCQWLKTGKTAAYQRALDMLKNNETRDVGANCAGFVTDVAAIELLSQLYQANRMTRSLSTLYSGASSLSANKNVPQVLVAQEVNRRTCKLLTALSSIYFGLHI